MNLKTILKFYAIKFYVVISSIQICQVKCLYLSVKIIKLVVLYCKITDYSKINLLKVLMDIKVHYVRFVMINKIVQVTYLQVLQVGIILIYF